MVLERRRSCITNRIVPVTVQTTSMKQMNEGQTLLMFFPQIIGVSCPAVLMTMESTVAQSPEDGGLVSENCLKSKRNWQTIMNEQKLEVIKDPHQLGLKSQTHVHESNLLKYCNLTEFFGVHLAMHMRRAT